MTVDKYRYYGALASILEKKVFVAFASPGICFQYSAFSPRGNNSNTQNYRPNKLQITCATFNLR